jgi:hypothetical protein
LRDGIPDAAWVRFEANSYYAHTKESERFLAVLDAFLTRVEKRLEISFDFR